MKPEYLEELADIADPEGLWRLSGIDQMDLSPEKRKQLDAGVALRRYSSHVRQLHQVLSDRRSYLITPLSALGQIAKMIDTPADHAAYRDRRIAPTAAVDKRASKTQFDILFDKMEYANGYGGTREALFAHVRDLEARTAAAPAVAVQEPMAPSSLMRRCGLHSDSAALRSAAKWAAETEAQQVGAAQEPAAQTGQKQGRWQVGDRAWTPYGVDTITRLSSGTGFTEAYFADLKLPPGCFAVNERDLRAAPQDASKAPAVFDPIALPDEIDKAFWDYTSCVAAASEDTSTAEDVRLESESRARFRSAIAAALAAAPPAADTVQQAPEGQR